MRKSLAHFITRSVYAVAIALGLLLAVVIGSAQTSTNLPPVTNAPPSSIWQTFADGLGSVSNWSVNPYFTYAKDAPTHYGGGILALYNVNDFVGVGLGGDWLGEFSKVSGDVSLRKEIHAFNFIGWTNVTLTPFGIAGLSTPISGAGRANGGLSTITGAGLALNLGHAWGGKFQTGYEYSVWNGDGKFSGARHHIFFGYRKGF